MKLAKDRPHAMFYQHDGKWFRLTATTRPLEAAKTLWSAELLRSQEKGVTVELKPVKDDRASVPTANYFLWKKLTA